MTSQVLEWIEDQFRSRREWLSEEIMAAARESGISRNAMFSAEVQELPIKKAQHVRADGTRYWTWTAQSGWLGDRWFQPAPEPESRQPVMTPAHFLFPARRLRDLLHRETPDLAATVHQARALAVDLVDAIEAAERRRQYLSQFAGEDHHDR
jgi:hypothetical protein